MRAKKMTSKQPVRLSNEELRKSRMGLLGRFPAESLFDPEEDQEKDDEYKAIAKKAGKRSAGSAS